MKAINLRAEAVIRNGALHPQVDVDWFFIPSFRGGRGMINAEDCAEMETEPKAVCKKQQNKDY